MFSSLGPVGRSVGKGNGCIATVVKPIVSPTYTATIRTGMGVGIAKSFFLIEDDIGFRKDLFTRA